MGRLTSVDSTTLIYLLQKHPKFGAAARRLFKRVKSGQEEAIFSKVGVIEILTGPKKTGRLELLEAYRLFLSTLPHFKTLGLDDQVVETASDLRAKYGLRTPDAIHIATAIVAGADRFITSDRRLVRIKEIKVELLAAKA